MSNGSPDVSLTVLNETIHEPIIYIGADTVLAVSLTNNSDTITFTAGASTFKIFMPTFFDASEFQKMEISLTNWTFSRDPAELALILTYSGPSPANWDKGQEISFKITSVLTNAAPTTDAVQINFERMGGNVPRQVQAPISLSTPPRPGNAPLREMLQVTFDNQGIVYVSTEADPLRNKLYLNFKNIGSTELYEGKTHWTGTPQVTIMFVYGNTSGALAPDDKVDDKDPPIGSAWNIKGALDIDQTGGWQIKPFDVTGDHPHPRWLMTPITTNEDIIGTGEHANVTFEFSKIVSLTAPGHTQAIVHFSGFMKDENTRYDDTVYVVDIVKQNPPATRGLLNFFGEQPIITITDPKPLINIDLTWAMMDVAKVNLICSFPGVNVVEKKYPNPEDPLAYDSCTIKIPGLRESGAVFFTLQAFKGDGAYLNSMQFAVFINALMFVDPRDGEVYPAIIVNSQMWMAKNLAHPEADAYAFADIPDNAKKYGRLYTAQAESVRKPPVPKWRIPSQQDWQALFDKFGNPNAAYTALIEGGTSGFNAKLGGWRNAEGQYDDLLKFGQYRTSTGETFAAFSKVTNSVNLAGKHPGSWALSIRYVRDL